MDDVDRRLSSWGSRPALLKRPLSLPLSLFPSFPLSLSLSLSLSFSLFLSLPLFLSLSLSLSLSLPLSLSLGVPALPPRLTQATLLPFLPRFLPLLHFAANIPRTRFTLSFPSLHTLSFFLFLSLLLSLLSIFSPLSLSLSPSLSPQCLHFRSPLSSLPLSFSVRVSLCRSLEAERLERLEAEYRQVHQRIDGGGGID